MKKSIGTGRGSVYTIILKALQTGDKYGYEICKEIEEKSNGLYVLKQPSLYSGLKRLEAQKDVYSYWGDSDIGGRRHYYSLTEKGKERIEKSNFSWEDGRDDFIPTLFEKTEEEKAVESLKEDVSSLSKDISEIQQINDEMEKQLNQSYEDKIDNLTDSPSLAKQQNDSSKIIRHTVSPLQQDLFSFVSYSNAQNIEEKTEEKSENLTEDILQEKVEGKTEEIKEQVNALTIQNNEETDISNNLVAQKEIANIDTEEDAEISKEKEAEVAKIQDGTISPSPQISDNFVNVKAEESVINVNDYLNLHSTKTMFDEEVKRDIKPITKEDLSQLTNFSGVIDINEDKEDKALLVDDSQDRAYEEYLKLIENDKVDDKLIENSEQNQIYTDNEQVCENSQLMQSEINSLESSQTTLEQTNQNTNYSNNFVTINETNNTDSYSNLDNINQSTDVAENNSFNQQSDYAKISNNENKDNMNLKEIFGDFIQEKQVVAEQTFETQQQPETTEMFKEYNNMNFKASDDLPRVDVSNNINLTLKSDNTSTPSAFKSYHDDEYESVSFDSYQQNFQASQPEMPTYSQNFCDVPFDQKYSQSKPVTEDYAVRKYRKIDESTLSSKYLNYSKVHAISCFSTSALMIVLTLIINLLVGSVFKVDATQQLYLTCEYILCGILLIYGISYQLLNKNKRIISNGNKMQYLIIFASVALIIGLVLLHILSGSLSNIFGNYATFIIPLLYLISIIIVQLFILKMKKTNLLYR